MKIRLARKMFLNNTSLLWHRRRRTEGVILALLILVVGAGCTHQMEVTNRADYQVSSIVGTPLDVAIASSEYSTEAIPYYDAVISALRNHPHINTVRSNWSAAQSEPGFDPSHCVKIDIKPEYRGDGENWLITWPGCYVFSCAWAGYNYHADIETVVTVAPSSPEAKNSLQRFGAETEAVTETIQTHFDMRHCDFNRGFWSGTGWWFPGWGLHNIATGAFFTKYEEKATQPFLQATDEIYGKYVANKIVEQLRDNGAVEYKRVISQR